VLLTMRDHRFTAAVYTRARVHGRTSCVRLSFHSPQYGIPTFFADGDSGGTHRRRLGRGVSSVGPRGTRNKYGTALAAQGMSVSPLTRPFVRTCCAGRHPLSQRCPNDVSQWRSLHRSRHIAKKARAVCSPAVQTGKRRRRHPALALGGVGVATMSACGLAIAGSRTALRTRRARAQYRRLASRDKFAREAILGSASRSTFQSVVVRICKHRAIHGRACLVRATPSNLRTGRRRPRLKQQSYVRQRPSLFCARL